MQEVERHMRGAAARHDSEDPLLQLGVALSVVRTNLPTVLYHPQASEVAVAELYLIIARAMRSRDWPLPSL